MDARAAFCRLMPAACAVAAVLLSAAADAAPENRRGMATAHVVVYYDPADEQTARIAAEAAEEALPMLTGALGLAIDDLEQRPIRIDIARTYRAMNELVGRPMSPWVRGVALPGRRIVVKSLIEPVLREVVAHEVTHVLLEETLGEQGIEVPRWLHEGLAQFANQDLSPGYRQVLGEASVAGRLMDIEQMEAAFSGSKAEVALAYAQSYTLARFLHELEPDGGFRTYLQHLQVTGDPDRAFIRTYGMTRQEIERKWRTQVRIEFLRDGIPLTAEVVIFGAMAVLVIVALLAQKRRRRIIRERLQEEERLRRIEEYTAFGEVSFSPEDEPKKPIGE